MQKQIKQVCKCENCGNEAEMVLTCTLEEDVADTPAVETRASEPTHKHQMKGHGVCSHCGAGTSSATGLGPSGFKVTGEGE